MSRRPRRGAALIETLMAIFVLSLLTTFLLSLGSLAGRTADRGLLETGMQARGRIALDEMLREVRAADQILVNRTISGQNVATGPSDLVLQAPGFNPAAGSGAQVLLAVKDAVAFRYDAAGRRFTETTVVAAGSRRPVRTALVLADNVQSVAFTYFARDAATADGATSVYTVEALPVAAPTAYVNGATAACTWTAGTNTVTLAARPAAGADVQFLYAVDPQASSGAALRYVSRVDVVLTLSQTDGRAVRRTVTLAGSAGPRNSRS